MSFYMHIALSKKDTMDMQKLRAIVPPDIRVQVHVHKPLFSKRCTNLSLSEKDSNRMAGFLTDRADPDSKTWDMYPELLPDLAKVLTILRENTKDGFQFEALWHGEVPENKVVTLEEMVQIVRSGQIETKIRYTVL